MVFRVGVYLIWLCLPRLFPRDSFVLSYFSMLVPRDDYVGWILWKKTVMNS